MNIEKIYRAVVTNWVVLFAFIFVFLAFRLHGDWSNTHLWLTALIQIGIALFLLQLNNIFSIIRHHTLLPAIFYLLFAGCNPVFSLDWKGSSAAFLMMVNYLFLFRAYQKPNPQLYALNISLVLVLGSFLQPQLLLFFPLFWFGFHWFRSFNMRVFLASLTGIFAVFLIVFAWSVFRNDWQMFLPYLPKPEEIFSIYEPDLSIYEWINLGIVLLVYVFAGYNLYVSDISERIRTVLFLKYIYLFSFLILFMAFVQAECRSFWELVAYISISLILAHYFTLTEKFSVKTVMLIFMLGLLTLGVFYNA